MSGGPRRRCRPLSLWGRLAATMALVMLLCLSGFGLYMAEAQQRAGLEQVGKLTRAIAANIDAAVAGDLIEQRLDQVESLLLRLALVGEVTELSVEDGAGRLVSRVRRDGAGAPYADYGGAAQALPAAPQEWLGPHYYRYRLPIVRGERIGAITVVSSLREQALLRRQLYSDTARAVLLAVLVSISLLWLVLRGMLVDLGEAMGFAGALSSTLGAQLPLAGRVREIDALVGVLNRISSELAQQHAALRASELRKSVILEVALDCLITIDEQGRIIDFNPAAESTFGYTLEQARGQPMDELIIPREQRAGHRAGLARYLAGGGGALLRRRIELLACRSNGEQFPVELAIIPFSVGGRHYFSGYLRDISERHRMADEAARSTALLTTALRELKYQQQALDAHAMVSITNARGEISYVNQRFASLSGHPVARFSGADHRVVASGLHPPAFFAQLWRQIAGGAVWHGEIANRCADGSLYWVAATIVPWLDERQQPYQYVCIGTDITVQKRTELALAEARARELQVGSAIQRALLWGSVPAQLDGVDIACHSAASQGVDGDFFSIKRHSDSCFELLVGDVMGKGVPAAMIGAAVKSTYCEVLYELAQEGGALPTPAAIVNRMHAALTARLMRLEAFVTLALYRIDTAAGTLTLVNAGHTAGLLWRAAEARVDTVLGDNLPIGVLAAECYRQYTHSIGAGDALLAYSDGITEARDGAGAEFGEARLAALLAEARAAALPSALALQALRYRLHGFVGGGPAGDDQSLVLIALAGAAPAAPALALPWDLGALAPLRQFVAGLAAGLAAPARDALVLASFEAATNTLRHGGRVGADAVLLCRQVEQEGALVIELLHAGPAFTPDGPAEADLSGAREGGFGLFIIAGSVDRVEYGALIDGVCRTRLTLALAPTVCQEFSLPTQSGPRRRF